MIKSTVRLLFAIAFGTCTLFAEISGYQPLTITQQPLSQNASPGSTVVLSVQVSGTPAPSFRWALNGEYIPGATSSQFSLKNIQPADSGAYSVTVFNSEDVVESQEAFVLVDAPKLAASDNFGGRGTIGGNSGVGWGDNTRATKELGELLTTGYHTMWVKWVAPANGWMTLRTEGSTFDTLLALYTPGLNLLNLLVLPNLVKKDDDSGDYHTSLIQFNAKAGQEYEISVAGATGNDAGIFYLSWAFVPGTPPPSFTLQPLSQTVNRGETVSFTVGLDISASLQWFFNDNPIPGATGKTLTLSSVKDANVGFYSVRATGLNGLSNFSATAELQINTEGANAGSRNKLQDSIVSGLLGSVVNLVGNLFSLLGAQPKQGFHTLDVAPSSGYSGTQVFATASGRDPGEPNHCGVVGGSSYWLTYSAPQAGRLTLNTDGSTFDTILAVYTDDGKGNGYNSLIPVACDNNSGADGKDSKVSFDVQPKVAYYVVVDGVNGATGTAYLNYSLNTAPTISAISNISISEDQNTGNVSFTISDKETSADNLRVVASSSNTSLAPSVSLSGTGGTRTFFIQSAANQSGSATISITVTDGQGASITARFTLTVNAVNDIPVAGPDSGTRKTGCSMNFYISTLLSNDSDPDGDTVTFNSCASRSNSGGTIVRNGSYLTYYPPSGFNGTDYFTYTIVDGKGGMGMGRVTVYCSSSSSSIQ